MRPFHTANGGQKCCGRPLPVTRYLTCCCGEIMACSQMATCITMYHIRGTDQRLISKLFIISGGYYSKIKQGSKNCMMLRSINGHIKWTSFNSITLLPINFKKL